MLMEISEDGSFFYSKDLEYVLAAQEFLMPLGRNSSIEKEVKEPDWGRYQVLKEFYAGLSQDTWGAILEPMTEFAMREFKLNDYESYLFDLDKTTFLSMFLQLPPKDIDEVGAEKINLVKFYQSHRDKFKNYLAVTILFEQTEWFLQEFFSFVRSLKSKETDKFLEKQEDVIAFWLGELTRKLKGMSSFALSEELMRKTFHNRGPYEQFFFMPAMFLPVKCCRFFARNQVLLFDPVHLNDQGDAIPKQLKVLADPTRFQILKMLKQEGHLTGIEIADKIGIATSTVSHHMTQMKNCGLVHEEPSKNNKYYSLNEASLRTCIESLQRIFLDNH